MAAHLPNISGLLGSVVGWHRAQRLGCRQPAAVTTEPCYRYIPRRLRDGRRQALDRWNHPLFPSSRSRPDGMVARRGGYPARRCVESIPGMAVLSCRALCAPVCPQEQDRLRLAMSCGDSGGPLFRKTYRSSLSRVSARKIQLLSLWWYQFRCSDGPRCQTLVHSFKRCDHFDHFLGNWFRPLPRNDRRSECVADRHGCYALIVANDCAIISKLGPGSVPGSCLL